MLLVLWSDHRFLIISILLRTQLHLAYEISVLFVISSEFPRPREVERDHNRRRKHVDIDGYFTS